MITVAIVSPSRSLEPISKVIEEHDFGCEFHKYIYNELSDIDWIYADCKDNCDVIFYSGELGTTISKTDSQTSISPVPLPLTVPRISSPSSSITRWSIRRPPLIGSL